MNAPRDSFTGDLRIDPDVDMDEPFIYDDTLSVEENFATWLSEVYDTFAGITNGDNYIELIEQYANETIVAIQINKGNFTALDGLPNRVLEILKEPATDVESMAKDTYVLTMAGGAHFQDGQPSVVRLKLEGNRYIDAEVEITKAGEDEFEPVDIVCKGSIVATISQMELLQLLISMHKDSSLVVTSDAELTPAEIDSAYKLLLEQIGEQQGFASTELKVYGPVGPQINKKNFSTGGIVVRHLDSADESVMHIDVAHHELLEDLDSDVIYRLHSELEHTKATPTQDNGKNTPEAEKIVSSPAGFSIKNLSMTMERAGIAKPVPIDKDYMVLMIRVVQEVLAQIAEPAN